MGLLDWVRRRDAHEPGGDAKTDAARRKAVEQEAKFSREGIEAIDAGKFFLACDAFRSAIELNPGSASHHVNLAFALMQIDEKEKARPHLAEAARLDPQSFDAHYMLSGLCETLGDRATALAHMTQAVALNPGFEGAQVDLCRLLVTEGKIEAAHIAIEAALQLHPQNTNFQLALGNVLLAENKSAEALVLYEQILETHDDMPQVHVNKALVLNVLGRFDEAIAAFEKALQIDPSSIDAHLGLGAVHMGRQQFKLATESIHRALALQPENVEAHNRLGLVQQEQGLIDEAIRTFERAIELQPDLAGSYANLGLALNDAGFNARAAEVFRRGLELKELEVLHQNLAIALFRLMYLDEAIHHARRAIEMAPENLANYINLAGIYGAEGRIDEAMAECRRAMAQKPELLVAHGNLLYYLSAGGTGADYLEAARQYGAKLAREPLPEVDIRGQSERRPLKVGLVSADLFEHPVGHFVEGILEKLDAGVVQLHAYATSLRRDAMTARLKPMFASWTVLAGMGDAEVARQMRADGIDILIDLSGHTAQNRLPVFAYRPAPVQATWLGYWASTGVPAIDYILADELCVPHGEEDAFVEKVWRLPDTRMCFTPIADAPEPGPLPALAHGAVTFGCFQRLSKITDDVLAVWGRIFRRLPQARLLVQNPQVARPQYARLLLDRLRDVGIEEHRVEILPSARRLQYLASYAKVDIVLDTFPFPGGTTTCEALWMGVPTVSLQGHSMISRQGAAMMSAAGLGEWVADSRDEYVETAVQFASDVPALQALRLGMRERLLKSPLFDVERFARNFEIAMQAMWGERVREADERPAQ